ncbi:MAG: hypothetical protein AAB368_14125, partial [bacterium]
MIRAGAVLLLLCAEAQGANVEGAGGFSRLAVGARGPALGGSITALDDGPTALAANPAGLARLEQPATLVLTGTALPLERSLNFIAAGGWATAATAVGIGALFYNPGGGIEFRRNNTELPDSVQTALSQAYTLGAAWRVFPPLEAGLSVKFLLDAAGNRSAWGFTGDLGLLYHPFRRFALSFVMQDAGGADLTGFNWSTEFHEQFARVLHAGASLDLNPLTLVGEVRDLADPRGTWSGGLELDVARPLTLRAGLEDGRLSAGFGIGARVRRRAAVRLDYALARDPIADAGLVHRVALSLSFVQDARP